MTALAWVAIVIVGLGTYVLFACAVGRLLGRRSDHLNRPEDR